MGKKQTALDLERLQSLRKRLYNIGDEVAHARRVMRDVDVHAEVGEPATEFQTECVANHFETIKGSVDVALIHLNDLEQWLRKKEK